MFTQVFLESCDDLVCVLDHVLSEGVLALELTLLFSESENAVLVIADPDIVAADEDLAIDRLTISANEVRIVNAYAILRCCSVEVGYATHALVVDVLLLFHFSFPFLAVLFGTVNRI